jgi:hypothetical protein
MGYNSETSLVTHIFLYVILFRKDWSWYVQNLKEICPLELILIYAFQQEARTKFKQKNTFT